MRSQAAAATTRSMVPPASIRSTAATATTRWSASGGTTPSAAQSTRSMAGTGTIRSMWRRATSIDGGAGRDFVLSSSIRQPDHHQSGRDQHRVDHTRFGNDTIDGSSQTRRGRGLLRWRQRHDYRQCVRRHHLVGVRQRHGDGRRRRRRDRRRRRRGQHLGRQRQRQPVCGCERYLHRRRRWLRCGLHHGRGDDDARSCGHAHRVRGGLRGRRQRRHVQWLRLDRQAGGLRGQPAPTS